MLNFDFEISKMFNNKNNLKEAFVKFLEVKYGKSVKESTIYEQYAALGSVVMAHAMSNWKKTRENVKNNQDKTLYYFSLEFLMGRMLSNNLMSLGIYDVTKEALEELGIDLNEIEDCEADAGLGNGGLGRLAACFLDSLASLNFAGNGNTIRYRNGLFKQLIIDNRQVEVPDQWLRYGYPWEIRKAEKGVSVRFYGDIEVYRDESGNLGFNHRNYEEVLAIPYDMPIVGADTYVTNTLRMWSAEPSDNLPSHMAYPEYLADVEKICLNLYPEDYTEEGKLTRIKQEYFFVSAGLQTIIREHLKNNDNLDNFADKVVIQLNDTHPALAVPELMRILLDDYGYQWDKAFDIVKHTFAYTNHTVLQEALEKWPVNYIKTLLPRIYLIIEEIDNRFVNSLRQLGKDDNFINSIRIISNGNVRMANLSIVGSFSINGVAKIHSDILVKDTFKNFYEIYPNMFNNKTNGITQRRWLLYSNRELVDLIKKYTKVDIRKDFNSLSELNKFVDNKELQQEFLDVKKGKKVELANYLNKLYGIEIDPNSIYDVQAKRLHAYKRQLLNIMYVISLYHRIHSEPDFNMPKTTFIFGAKAAGTYYFAKDVIRLINCVGKTIDNDPVASKFIKVVFIPNYRVTIAEKLMPAADVSEQISTAGKEASGTGNMKFMMNGAVTLGTLDGANVEIRDLVGDDNIVIFGMDENEVAARKQDYHPYDYYQNDPELKRIIDSLTDGTFDEDKNAFLDVANEFLLRNDEYMILADFHSYKDAHDKIYGLYQDKEKWARMCLCNIANSSFFSSDRTINDYVNDIWHLDKIK